MTYLGSLISHLLIKWNQETYILLRIRFLIGLLLVLYTMMYFFADRRVSPKAGSASIWNLLDALSDSILVYILGIMQAAPAKNDLFPVLALALVSFRSSVNCLILYGAYAELRNMLKLLAVAYMKVTHGFKLWCVPFWIFWFFLVLKTINRILARYLVSKSLWHGRSSVLLQEYMDDVTPERCDPETMEGYRYLVYGESNRNIGIGHNLNINDSRSLITLDKIWRYDGPLLRRININGNNMKDLCLAFALSRLLRCRLEGATLHEGSVSTTRKLICSRILTGTAEVPADDAEKVLIKNANKAFGIIGMDLGFLNDYLHTSYPMIFCQGLLSLAITVVLSVVKHGMALWLYVDMSHAQKYYATRLTKKQAVDPDYPLALAAMVFVTFMDLWEVMNYVTSYWTTLLCICKYVDGRKIYGHFIFPWGVRIFLLLFFNSTRTGNLFEGEASQQGWRIFLQYHFNKRRKPGIGTVGQYLFVRSFNYSAWTWKLVHKITVGFIASKGDGTKLSGAIKLPAIVKAKVFKALCRLRSKNFEDHCLQAELTSLLCAGDDQTNQHCSECLQLPTCSQVILVWHIATSICEMKLAQDRGIGLRKEPGWLHSSLSWLCSRLQCQPSYLLDERSIDGDLRTNYMVANSLSRYCAYLLVAKPDLLPDTILVPEVILQKTVSHAREMLKGCDSLQSMHDKLKEIANQEPSAQGIQDRKLNINLVRRGAILGKKLIEDDEHHWELLAKVWVGLLVHIAPSSNAEAHARYLASGGEFVTLIWALFCHCGIEKSQLWQENATSRSNGVAPGGSSQQQSNGVAPGSSQQQSNGVASPPPAAQPDGHASVVEGGGEGIEEVMETSPRPQDIQ